MNPALILAARHWRAIGLAALVAFAGVQTMRLGHAKADQFDRTACVAGKPCKPPKWKAEVGELRGRVSKAEFDLQRCSADVEALTATVGRQKAVTAAIQALSDRKIAESTQAVQVASRGRAEAERRAAILASRPPVGVDDCARMDAADRNVMENLR